MNLTTRQQKIYEDIYSLDSSWDKESFAKIWNDILRLNKYVSVSKQGKLLLEFSDPNFTIIRFFRDDRILFEEKVHWNEFITFNEKSDEVKELAYAIKNLAERIITN